MEAFLVTVLVLAVVAAAGFSLVAVYQLFKAQA